MYILAMELVCLYRKLKADCFNRYGSVRLWSMYATMANEE